MGLSLYNLFKAGLLILNAMAVLHETRLLKKYGLHGRYGPGEEVSAVKQQIAGLLTATRYMRVPLIIMNLLIVVVELIFG